MEGTNIMAGSPVETAARFLTTLFLPGDVVLFRPIETYMEGGKKASRNDYHGLSYHRIGLPVGKNPDGTTKCAPLPSRTEAAVAHYIERAESERTNCFFGVCPRYNCGSDQASFDESWQIRTVRTLWSDVDDAPDVAVVLDRCTAAGLPVPSIAVASGHGAHLYWLLDSPLAIPVTCESAVHTEFIDQGEGKKKKRKLWIPGESPGEKLYLDVPTHRPALSILGQQVQDTLSGIAAAIGGDHTKDLARILRIPGTMNRKNERNGTKPVPCEMLVCEPNRRYPFSTFAKFEQASPQRIDRERIARIPLPKTKRLTARGQTRLESLMADCVAADPGTRSEVDYHLCCWAVEQGQLADEVWTSVAGIGRFAESGRRYFDRTWAAACTNTRTKRYAESRTKISKRVAEKEIDGDTQPESFEPISNGYREGDDDQSPLLALEMGVIISDIFARTGDWPRRIGSTLFVHDKGRSVDMLTGPEALFGWLSSKCGIVPWSNGSGFITKGELYAELCRQAKEYKAIEYLPHWPPMPGHYYACETPVPGDGSTLAKLLDKFCPETPIDLNLILLMFATPFWVGRGGTRPGFIVTSHGRGAGKSKLSELASRLAGGYIEVREYEDAAVMRQRLLSEEAMLKRIARLDNVKSLKFSWSDLESTMTAEVLSGKRMYYGETSRPNNLTWFLTLNGISLSTDMAQRCVIIRIRRPTHEGSWDNDIVNFMDEHRQELIGDLLGFLQIEESAPLPKNSRWGAWEAALLCRFENASDIQAVITERSAGADTEFEEAMMIEEHFGKCLQDLEYDTATAKVHIPSKIVAQWYKEATNNNRASVIGVTKIMAQFCEEGRLEKISVNPTRTYGRGFLWTGNSELRIDADYDIEEKIEHKKILEAEKRAELYKRNSSSRGYLP